MFLLGQDRVALDFPVDVYFGWSFREFTDGGIQFVVLEILLYFYLLNSAHIYEISKHINIRIIADVAESCREDQVAAFFEADEHLLKDFDVKMVAMDEASGSDESESVSQFVRKCLHILFLAELVLDQLLVGLFTGGDVKHILTHINARNFREIIHLEVLTD